MWQDVIAIPPAKSDGDTVILDPATGRAREPGYVAIRVRDSGLGIPPEEQKQIFRKFVRGAAARAVNIKGTGIGLAMVDHIVRAHSGEVSVESRPGAGSTFTVRLPLCHES